MLSFLFGSFLFGPIVTATICGVILYKTGLIKVSVPKIKNPFKRFTKRVSSGGTPMVFAKKTCKRCKSDYLYIIGEESEYPEKLRGFSYENDEGELVSLQDMCPTCAEEFTKVLNAVQLRDGKVIMSNQAKELAKLINSVSK